MDILGTICEETVNQQKKAPLRVAAALRLSKSPPNFFDSLHNASLFVRFAVPKAAALRRKRLLTQAFCRHSIQNERASALSYSPCETVLFFVKQ